MDYRDEIVAKLHDTLIGLKKGEGLEWLNSSLNTIHDRGMNLTVQSFLSGMSDYGKANGFLLEIEIALATIDAFNSSTICSEQTEGTATKPCDITIKNTDFRADIQCKNILNIHNELFLEEFLNWMRSAFSHVLPGRLVEIQASTKADGKTFKELRDWFTENHSQMVMEEEYTFEDAAQTGKVWMSLLEANGPGIREGIIYSASDTPFLAQDEDATKIQKLLLNRMKQARNTFGFLPGPNQFNLVAIELPSLNALVDEESIVSALYGTEKMVLLKDGRAIPQTQPDGLFYTHKSLLAFCSGVIYSESRKFGVPNCILFPNYDHVSYIEKWINHQGSFRVTDKIDLSDFN